jgi:hypothetical protein
MSADLDQWSLAAHHEGGHLVAAFVCGWPWCFCKIYDAGDGEIGGEIYAQWDDGYDPLTRAFIGLAGPFAEARYRGVDAFDPEHTERWRTDIANTRRALARLGPVNLGRLMARVDGFVAELWPQIEVIADALQRRHRLDYDDVAKLLGERSRVGPRPS